MEKKITDLLDCIQDDTVQLHTEDVTSIERIKEITMKKLRENTVLHKRTVKLSTILIAAAITVSLLTGTAFAIYYFSLRDMVLPINTDSPAVSSDTDSPAVSSGTEAPAVSSGTITTRVWPVPVGDNISPQGYSDSNEYKAFAEWEAYIQGQSYDVDGSIYAALGNNWPDIEEKYFSYYRAYTQEMADKLDEIAAKYGLSLHTARTGYDAPELMETVAGGSFIKGYTPMSGYVYEDGTFKLEGVLEDEADTTEDFRETRYADDRFTDDTVMVIYNEETDGFTILYNNEPPDNVDEILAPNTHTGPVILTTFDEYEGDLRRMRTDLTWFTMWYCKKGTITDISHYIWDVNDYIEWQYKTACGVTVSIAQSPYQALIIVQLENAFVTVRTMGSEVLPRDRLEAFADAIDFTLLK